MLVSCYKHIKKATNISCSFIAMKTSPEKREGRLFKGLFVFRQPGKQRGNKLGNKRWRQATRSPRDGRCCTFDCTGRLVGGNQSPNSCC